MTPKSDPPRPRSFSTQLLWQYATWLKGYLWCSQNWQLCRGLRPLSTRNFLMPCREDMKTLSTSLTRGDDPLGCCIIFRDVSLSWFLALKTCLCPDIRVFFFFLKSTYHSTASYPPSSFKTAATKLTALLKNSHNSGDFGKPENRASHSHVTYVFQGTSSVAS